MARDAVQKDRTRQYSGELGLAVRRRLASAAGQPPVGGLPQNLRVLLIEDDPGYAMLVRQLLLANEGRPSGRVQLTSVEQLSNGLARLADRNALDVVLLDLGLPDSDGLKTLARVRQQAPGVPVVVLTGAADERLALEALQRGAQDYLIKTDTDGEKLRRSVRYAIERQRLLETLENLSLVDDLTGLYNRRGFFLLAARQFASGRRRSSELVLVLADVDGLKQINDRYGHLEGDRVLVTVSEYLKRVCREEDIVARLGGDEFAVLLSESSVESARRVTARLQQQLARYNRRRLSRGRVSVSVGLAGSGPKARRSLQRLLAEADADMYRQKKNGRPRARRS